MTEIERRRTFAIISHPDAGKTTITEKLLLYAGAVHMAGSIKSRKSARYAVSDWMAMERERGISITSTVLAFDYQDRKLNLVDTPGHADFSEDTYRTLAAVDSATMLIDGMKGVEDRTRRLFEVCRMRHLPIITFVNKMDRPGRDPFDLMDEVSRTLNIAVTPLNWPIGEGKEFCGVADMRTRRCHLYERSETHGATIVPEREFALDDPALLEAVGDSIFNKLMEDLDLLSAGDPWDNDRFLAGELTPFFFGSAMNNFGVTPLLNAIIELAPPPGPRPTTEGQRDPLQPDFSGFVFKIQANMNPRHRDRIAFVRVVSGSFERGMEVTLARTGGTIKLTKPHSFVGTEREIVDEASPGDIIGLFDTGELRIGDTLCVGTPFQFEGIPRFAPEHFARIKPKDPAKRKHMQNGLRQLSQEGAIQLFIREDLGEGEPYVGVVGQLQFDVLISRLEVEYNTVITLERAPFTAARWLIADDAAIEWLKQRSDYVLVRDRDNKPAVLVQRLWSLTVAQERNPKLKLLDISPL